MYEDFLFLVFFNYVIIMYIEEISVKVCSC